MQFKREICRNFQRGSCKYGANCRYIHDNQLLPKSNNNNNPFGFGTQSATNQQQPKSNNNPFGFGTQSATNQQQPKSNNNPFGLGTQSASNQQQPKSNSNPFGFGTQSTSNQQQQQKPNPFGFGVQNQNNGPNNFVNRQNQAKPFENKWSRLSQSNTGGGAPSAKQPDSQSANHTCTDPASCKRQIEEDCQKEKPIWGLTCYGHGRNGPCDIVGDVSYEELRALAYDEAKRGLSLQSIVEREKSLFISKACEFDNLLRNLPFKSGLASQSPFPAAPATSNVFSVTPQNSAPPSSVPNFGQSGAFPNVGIGIRPSAPSNTAFVQPNSFPNASQTSTALEAQNFPGPFGSQPSAPAIKSPFTPNMGNFISNSVIITGSNPFPTPSVSTHNPTPFSFNNQAPILSGNPVSSSNAAGQASTSQLVNNSQSETVTVDASIWSKEKWTPGEIPEEAPPDAYVRN